MKLKEFLLLGLLFCSGLLYAQTDFRPGYIIKPNGDTLTGEIDWRGDYLMGKLCRFKAKGSEEEIKYAPEDIIGYRFIDDKYYVSKEIDGKKEFLEFLIKGKVNVYYLRDDKDHYFLEKEGLEIAEIPYEEEIRYKNNKPYLFKSTKHVGVLSYYMDDVPEFRSRIAEIDKPERKKLN